jgi:hypothetical protein
VTGEWSIYHNPWTRITAQPSGAFRIPGGTGVGTTAWASINTNVTPGNRTIRIEQDETANAGIFFANIIFFNAPLDPEGGSPGGGAGVSEVGRIQLDGMGAPPINDMASGEGGFWERQVTIPSGAQSMIINFTVGGGASTHFALVFLSIT